MLKLFVFVDIRLTSLSTLWLVCNPSMTFRDKHKEQQLLKILDIKQVIIQLVVADN